MQDILRNLTPEAKEDILEKEYGIATSVEMKEDMRLMCNLSDLIEERGIKRGVEQGIERGIKALVETCKELGISQEDTQALLQFWQLQATFFRLRVPERLTIWRNAFMVCTGKKKILD